MIRPFFAVAMGGLCVFAFAPFGFHVLAPLAFAGLVYLWSDAMPGRGLLYGLLFGCGLFGGGVSWVFVSLHVYGQMPPAMAVLAVIGFVLYLALFPALIGYLQARLFAPDSAVRVLVAAPSLWVLGEWLRGWLLTGFPWLNLGYSQVDTPLAGYAPLVGVYGVSLAVAGIASAIAYSLLRRTIVSAGICLLVVLTMIGGGRLMENVAWARPAGAPLSVALVQGNIGLDDKWAPASRNPILNTYLALSAGQDQADLVVWPESAVPMYFDEIHPWLFDHLAAKPGEYIIGVLERRETTAGEVAYNSVAVTGDSVELYRKEHLVPFGEFLPWPGLFRWVVDYLQIPMADFQPWRTTQAPLQVAGTTVGISVCYEDAFPSQVRKTLPAARLLVNVSEDAWFGDSLAPHQRLEMARMRALETARPMLRAANTGVSAIIDHRGRAERISPQFQRFVLTGQVQPMQGATPYVWLGDVLVLALAALLFSTSLLVQLNQHQGRQPQ